jgi:hypothetical protein
MEFLETFPVVLKDLTCVSIFVFLKVFLAFIFVLDKLISSKIKEIKQMKEEMKDEIKNGILYWNGQPKPIPGEEDVRNSQRREAAGPKRRDDD